MINIQDKLPINAMQASNILQHYSNNVGLYVDIERVNDYIVYFMRQRETYLKKFMKSLNLITFTLGNREATLDIFTRALEIPAKKLLEDNKVSFGSKVLDRLMEDSSIPAERREIIGLLRKSLMGKWYVSYLQQYLACELYPTESEEGHRLGVLHPTWSILNTNRLAAANPSLQNLPKDIPDIKNCPKGLISIAVDSGQIEPRITYSHFIPDPLIKKYIIMNNDAYLGMLNYILLTAEDEKALRASGANPQKAEVTEELLNKRKILKKIQLVGNYGGDLTPYPPELANGFMSKIVNHPMRLALEAKVKDAVLRGQTTFYTAFGTPITPGNTTNYKEGESGWLQHLVRCGINNPIQGTASDLMVASVYEADRLIREECKGKTSIAYYKHDEGCFYVDADKDEHLIPKFKEMTSYQVRDWIPIYAEAEVGVMSGIEEAKHY